MNVNTLLSDIARTAPESELRQFACACCRRLLPMFPDLDLEELLLFGGSRGSGEPSREQAARLRSRFGEIYDSLYPGYGDPSAKVLALSAVGEAAFTDSPLNAAINALEFCADAIAKAAAEPSAKYDDDYEAAYATERGVQAEMLQRYFSK
ncbi:hypothetical protein [Blastopirellula marina]|uniref:Uncharacterized protein n=1 Tax=Blastopirellula marina TaxID=124 RepID=A0A2S8F9Y9_9BACT|nr:hypothetical protein [Blastopirellula marina]PQO28983.1 hypothetical protein C5Y98_22490 [Blastopirellula marina]PQO43866.1 hypothetical protein C5Y93_22025 [Blastopirellula marina]PTL42255.1 hypothetical protein C5Y97_22500 [Blastopirellula marina]